MKPISSPLQILDFAVTKMDFELVPGIEHSEPGKIFKQYELDIDFKLFKNEILKVAIQVEVNRGVNRLPGYSLKAEAVCLFEFEKSMKISDGERKSIEGFSTLYIALNSIRGMISHFTANAPYGRFILPSIDLNDLIQQKRAAVQDIKSKKAKLEDISPSKAKPRTKKKINE